MSEAAKQRMLANRGEPLFLARWDRTVFIHYEAEPESLQRYVPFQLDLRDGRAFVSIVAFTLLRMRPRIGERLGEWLSNALAVCLGPQTFGLPYRLGHLHYKHDENDDKMRGCVKAKPGQFAYHGGVLKGEPSACEAESLTEFLLERCTAFTQYSRRRRFFRVWHPPWPQLPLHLDVSADNLMAATSDWWLDARKIGATYSPGVNVWMGHPHRTD